ncbi:molybdopterin molybdotransferase MoeA [Gordonia westfalica]|uniref:Molybdopterin molybdenumtransferase n=1 Tax=Gordonia westfalica TaxID=158898 RepID=A0ABU2GZ47_9ACTN|nr:gephyrin-like molybdotransferase Glp [Gordonia westfalica]MDS1116739.1 molybdopterin molybdotransferase MoeA [Gordonia westfalica]
MSYTAHLAAIGSAFLAARQRSSTLIPVRDGLGQLLAEDAHSKVDLPIFRNSQMDGFAVDVASVARVPAELTVTAVLAAGWSGSAEHVPGAAERIMTGAAMPVGADTVIPIEDTEPADVDGRIVVRSSRPVGAFVREAGSDIAKGSTVVPAGTYLAPRHLAAMACAGIESILVRPQLSVAVVTTGAELVAPGEQIGPGQIYDGNLVGLASCLIRDGARVAHAERSPDHPAELRKILDRIVGDVDLIVTSGGISAGDFEVVRETLSDGTFRHVAMQPGGPQGIAVYEGTPVLCFPGNPVSTLVSYEVFARAVIREDAGLPAKARTTSRLTQPLTSLAGKRQFFRGKLGDTGVTPVAGPGSHLVAAMASADCLIDIPEDNTDIDEGAEVSTWPL